MVVGDAEVVLTAKEALSIAQSMHPGILVQETEYEIENNTLYFTTTFADESEEKINLFTGENEVSVEEAGFFYRLVDDFDEKVIWVALFVFALAALASLYVANQALIPIAYNVRRQKEFVSGAAHELRNPLAALHARIEALLRVKDAEMSADVLKDLLTETKHLIALSEDLLALEKGEMRSKNIREIVVSELIESTVLRVDAMAEEKEITVTTDIGADTLRIDPKDFETILYNLLHNAIKYTPHGGTISVNWKHNTLTIADTGRGIPKKDIPHIFDRFYKVDASRGKEGSGLGLALVKEVVEKYGATISVQSEEEKGSMFIIKFS